MNNPDSTTTKTGSGANENEGRRHLESTFNDQTGNFTAELCQFLTSLAKTPNDQYEDLSFHLTRLREALLIEVDTESDSRSKRSSESSSEGDFSLHNSSQSTNGMVSSDASPQTPRSRTDSTNYSSASPMSQSSDASGSPNRENDLRKKQTKSLVTKSKEGARVFFSLQSGAIYELREEDIEEAFSQFGDVVYIRVKKNPCKGVNGYVDFASPTSAKEAVNRGLQCGQCVLHTIMPWSSLTERPVPYQILLESRYLPNVYEKQMVLKSFFSKFGIVNGVVFLGYRADNIQRFIISFRENQPAQDLIGSSVKILSSTVFVKEVTSRTIGLNSFYP